MSDSLEQAHLLSDTTREAIGREVGRYPDSRSCLIPALRRAQQERGWLSKDVLDEVAHLVGEDSNALASLATFYDMFYMQPVGRFVISCCSGFACYLNGGDDLIDYLSTRLEIPVGGTTNDGLFTLQPMECLAGCGIAPMILVDGDYHGNLTRDAVDAILRDLRTKAATDPNPVFFER